MSDGSLNGRRAVVTGATRGIGQAVAEALAREGVQVVVTGRDRTSLSTLATRLGAVAVPADLGVVRDVEQLAEAAAVGGPIDLVVNAAGAFALAAVDRTSLEAFDAMLAVNLRGPFLVIRAFLPGMLERRSGHIVSIGSIAGRNPFPHNGAYAASKFGLRGLHAVLDAELRGTGVRATLVEPAATDTALWNAVDRQANPGLPSRSAMMRPEDVADAVLFAVTRRPEVDVHNLILERA